MNNTTFGIAGMGETSPTTFIINLSNFIPGGYSILYYGCVVFGMMVVANAFFRQMQTAKGRGDHSAVENLMHACFGAAFAVIGEWIGYLGKGVFGDFQDVSVLLYVAKESDNLARVAITAFMYMLQFIGACCCVVALRMANTISTGRQRPDATWTSVFWFTSGGLSLVFIQKTIGVFSAMTGMPLAQFINSV
jgi:hypothetical protein